MVPTSNPNILLAALGSNVVEVDVEKRKTGRIVAFVSTDDNAEGTRFNDGKATPQGVFIVGRMNRAWRDGQPGKLFAMDLRVPGNSFGLLTILGPTEVSPFAANWCVGCKSAFSLLAQWTCTFLKLICRLSSAINLDIQIQLCASDVTLNTNTKIQRCCRVYMQEC